MYTQLQISVGFTSSVLSLVDSRWLLEPSEPCELNRASIAFLMHCFPADASVQGVDRYAINLH
jgi:hypothetical protein